MILIDENLILRAIEIKDAIFLKEMINNPDLENSVLGWSFPVSEKDQYEWINNIKNVNEVKYIIENEGIAIGMASITSIDYKNSTANLNIKIKDIQYKRKGIGFKTINLLIRYCFDELNLNCLTANILDYNIASQRLFEKCGFTKEALLRSRIYKKGNYHDIFIYSILKSEFIK